MSQVDQQLGCSTEVTYGTAVTPVTRFFEFNSESIQETAMRTEGDPLRSQYFKREDRFTPYYGGAAGTISLDVMTKGFGFWIKQMTGSVATTGPVETTVYTHSSASTVADLLGAAFDAQFSRPFAPSGTAQPMLYKGGKVTAWTLSNSVDGNLVAELECDFQDVDTVTALATASYPSSMENLTWAGGVVTVGGSAFDLTEFSASVNNGLAVDRRFIRGNTLKKEPLGGRRELTFSMSADFDSLTQRTRVNSATRAGALAAIVATWTGPTLLGSTLFPKLVLTIPSARFDQWSANNDSPDSLSQELSGVGLTPAAGTAAFTLAYSSADVTP
jgi:hypothetical protein